MHLDENKMTNMFILIHWPSDKLKVTRQNLKSPKYSNIDMHLKPQKFDLQHFEMYYVNYAGSWPILKFVHYNTIILNLGYFNTFCMRLEATKKYLCLRNNLNSTYHGILQHIDLILAKKQEPRNCYIDSKINTLYDP